MYGDTCKWSQEVFIMLHDVIHSLLVVTCHYTSGNLFFPDPERPWEPEDIEDEYDEE